MSEISAFDPSVFLDATTTEAAEKRDNLPAANPESPDGLYTGIITELTGRRWQGKEDPSKSGIAFDAKIQVQIPASLQAGIGTPTLTLQDSIMADITPGGGLDWSKGHNNRLRTYREATGMNVPGQPFSPRMLQGQPIKVKVKHEIYNDNIQERVAAVFKA